MLEGRIVSPDGSPVSDAVIRSMCAWGDPKRGICCRAGLSYTDETGEFWLGYIKAVTNVNLNVQSPTYGTTSFLAVPIGDGPVELELMEPSRLIGRITRPDGQPAEGYRVLLRGTLRYPMFGGTAGQFTDEYTAQVGADGLGDANGEQSDRSTTQHGHRLTG